MIHTLLGTYPKSPHICVLGGVNKSVCCHDYLLNRRMFKYNHMLKYNHKMKLYTAGILNESQKLKIEGKKKEVCRMVIVGYNSYKAYTMQDHMDVLEALKTHTFKMAAPNSRWQWPLWDR